MKETYTLKEIEEKLEHEKYLRKENQELYEELQKKEAMYDSLAVDYRLSQEEIERLNNNWNKLEEWLNIQQNISSPEQILNNIFSKLQELKGSDK